MAIAATIEPPIHSPQVCEPEIKYPPKAPTCTSASSMTKARVAVAKRYIDALARSGRLEEARLAFEKMSTYANHLGLYSEEIGLTGETLGNFPQAFSHLAHINAALNLDFQLDHGPGRVEPVLSASWGGR
jgi:hypothetical protein